MQKLPVINLVILMQSDLFTVGRFLLVLDLYGYLTSVVLGQNKIFRFVLIMAGDSILAHIKKMLE